MTIVLLITALLVLLFFQFLGHGVLAWGGAFVVAMAGWAYAEPNWLVWGLVAIVVGGIIALLSVPPLRRMVLTARMMGFMQKAMPRLGDTERIALEAGTVWWDGELFSGRPRWRKLIKFKQHKLNKEEQAFLDGPVEDLCAMLDDWQINQERDLPEDVWTFLKENGFFGLIVPAEYGGKGFSATAQSAVVTRIASRSVTAAVTVMVPNSLGPAELLLHYGTQKQQDHYLPRLADGREIPCFALTGPEAGSDAAATQSTGVVEKGTYKGKKVIGIRLNWKKRYITLAPVASLIGLAFRLYDPDKLIGDIEDRGITCALVPRKLKGIEIGQRHDPMGIPFHNGPTVGTDVFVPIDQIIGGAERAGQGWRMLMESLAAGRSISLPSLSVGAAQIATRLVGAYATIREQFDTPIGRFEGIEEPMARIGAKTYTMNAARRLTCSALDDGHKPSVVSAIVKAYLTDGMREVLTDAMDIRAGAGIQRGPRNVLSRAYMAVPIGITVEGANILTRSMIIYGQGAIRCHPFIQKEMETVANGDMEGFDKAIFGHMNHFMRNMVRALVLGLSRSVFAGSPVMSQTRKYYRHLGRLSAAFAIASDTAMATLGGKLKRREKISGRLADALAYLYLASAALKQFHDDGSKRRDLPFVRYACEHALFEIQSALRETFRNLPGPLASVMGRIAFPLGSTYKPPSDRLGGDVARGLLEDREARIHLTQDIFIPPTDEPGLGQMEAALDHAVEAHKVETKLRDAVRAGTLDRAPGDALARAGVAAGVITDGEFEILKNAADCRREVIQVDAFDPEEYKSLH